MTLPVPEVFDDHTLTEYVETVLLIDEDKHLSLAELVDAFPAGARPSAAEIGLLRSEVTRRSFLLGAMYPYRADEAGVFRLANAPHGIYDFLLLLSLEYAPYRRAKEFNRVNRIFDLIVRECLKERLGPTGRAVRFGTPVEDGRPTRFEDAIPWLAGEMGVATLTEDLLVDENDGGVDVVAWQPWASGRSGFPVWLVQCTVQMGYESKAAQISTERWKQTLAIGPTPLTALAVPFTVREGDDRWMKVTLDVTTLLDRIRICEAAAEVDFEPFAETADMLTFIEAEVTRLRDVLADGTDLDYNNEVNAASPLLPRVAKPRRQRASSARSDLRR